MNFLAIFISITLLRLNSQPENSLSRESNPTSLIAAEYRPDSAGMGSYAYLVSYNFNEGRLVSKDTIFGAEVTKAERPGSYVRYDLGKNFIYQDRYVISGIGNVIDLHTKSLVIEESDKFIEASGDSLIFYRSNIFTGTGFLVLDLKTKNYGFVQNKDFRAVKGLQSPDNSHGIEVDQTELPYKIILYNDRNQASTIINNCGKGTPLSITSSSIPEVPLYWLDNANFLYVNFLNKANIRKVNIFSKTDKSIAIIDSIPLGNSNAKFEKDQIGNLIFHCAKGDYIIDHEKEKISFYTYRQLGHKFQIGQQGNSQGKDIIFMDEVIGKLWSSPNRVKTSDGYIAMEYWEPAASTTYPKGIKVWNKTSKSWTTINVPWLCTLVGWIPGNNSR